MNRAITYVMSYPAHLLYLVVSLRSLRRHWNGPVFVHAWPESIELVKRIEEDSHLDVLAVPWEPEYRGKNAQFESKQLVVQSAAPENLILYLDADTLIAGPLDELFDRAAEFGFLATQFCEWVTTGKIMQSRIKRLRKFPNIDQGPVEEVLARRWPSVNGGIFCCHPNSPVLSKWHAWTKVARSIFISDETVLHAVMPQAVWMGSMDVYPGGVYNCSPKYQPSTLPDSEVKIWHFHGDCNSRPQKSLRSVLMWWPEYQECLRDNVGGMAEWRKDVHHRFLDPLERGLIAAGDDWRARAEELVQKGRQGHAS